MIMGAGCSQGTLVIFFMGRAQGESNNHIWDCSCYRNSYVFCSQGPCFVFGEHKKEIEQLHGCIIIAIRKYVFRKED